jgi:mannose-1-phosphate guanylyltransferase/mannose-6-phosphate isomerase
MYAVIMAGGGGTRLWPLSRSARPKPFLPLVGETTLLQATVARLAPLIVSGDVYIVTDGRYADLVREQLPDLPEANILAEPLGRNTAAAVALAALAIDRPASEVMAVLPADHRIADPEGFRAALAAAAERAAGGDLVTLGITPSGPETGYGYVLATGDARPVLGMPSYRVERFVEKPSVERASQLLASGHASWNAGIFVWRRDAVTTGLERHAADIMDPLRAALAAGGAALAATYPTLRSTSIDYALLEPTSLEGHVAVIPAEVGWSDLGSWAALLEARSADAAAGRADAAGGHDASARDETLGTGVVGHTDAGSEVISVGSRDVLVHAVGGRLVVVVGLADVIVVDTPDALLVCARDAAQDVKRVVDALAAEGRRDRL